MSKAYGRLFIRNRMFHQTVPHDDKVMFINRIVYLALLVLLNAQQRVIANDTDAVFLVHDVIKIIPGHTGPPVVSGNSTLVYENVEAARLALANLTAGGSGKPIPNVCNSTLSPCDVNADCMDISPSLVQCRCRKGFNDSACTTAFFPHGIVPTGTSCPDINECDRGPCHQMADCNNTPGSFVCTCRSGFTGNGTTCNDFDECTNNLHDCHVNADCGNEEGSHKCSCKKGYTGDGMTCTDIDECQTGVDNCYGTSTCQNQVPGFQCLCSSGFAWNGTTCEQINECDQAALNDCDTNAECTDTHGSYYCTCRTGYSGNGSRCEDIDECALTSSCDRNAFCTNTGGSFACDCMNGYHGNGLVCADVDECSSGTNNCDKACFNYAGGFFCYADSGFTGTETTTTTTETPTSTPVTTPAPKCPENASSFGTDGCVCDQGFTGNGRICTEIGNRSNRPSGSIFLLAFLFATQLMLIRILL